MSTLLLSHGLFLLHRLKVSLKNYLFCIIPLTNSLFGAVSFYFN
nr:MAG TPA: hypothetical protein [Caudoviricetes sp.]